MDLEKVKRGEIKNLRGVDLREANLKWVDLRGLDLTGSDLRKANLTGVNLRGADLKGADLKGVYLKWADLTNADLREVNLTNADLREVNLTNADLKWINLRCANLRGANLKGANLREANLKDADLIGVNLRGSDLTGADLTGANLRYVKVDHMTTGYNIACPEKGEFIGYKKANGCLIKLLILEDSKRSSATTAKCRCDKAKVLDIEDIATGEKINSVSSGFDENFIYEVGKIVKVDDFDENRWNECSAGIHFFVNKENAINY